MSPRHLESKLGRPWTCKQGEPRARSCRMRVRARPAFDAVHVPPAVALPPASFGFRLAADTLALGQRLSLATPAGDLHPQTKAHAGRTSQRTGGLAAGSPSASSDLPAVDRETQARTCGLRI